MHVLSIAPLLPFPPNHGWRVRTWHLLRCLADHATVTLLTWEPEATPLEHRAAVAGVVDQLLLFPQVRPPMRLADRIGRQARFLAGGAPPFVQAMTDERSASFAAAGAAIAARHRQLPIDVVVFEEEAMRGMPLPPIPAPVVVHRLDAFARALREVRAASRMGRFVTRLEHRRWEAFDRSVLVGTALGIATSPEVREELVPIAGGVPLDVVLNGVELRPRVAPPETGHDVAFIGSMDYGPNIDAVLWFAADLWPLLSHDLPGSRFRVIGRDPVAEVRALAGTTVDVTGEVPDVGAACEGVRVGVVPLRAGMGIKNKTLDFMSVGIPVVVTSSGAEGIAAGSDDGLIRVDGPDEIVDAVRWLMRDDDAVCRLGTAARAYVERNHAWSSIAAGYVEMLEGVVSRSRQLHGDETAR